MMQTVQLAARPWMTTLAETGDPSVKAVLVELIDRPDLSDQRATLVNCLARFDCSNKFLWLVNLVCQGNWEVAHGFRYLG
jgi:hypothetical protein